MSFWNERVWRQIIYFEVIIRESPGGFEMPSSVSTFNCYMYSIAQGTNIGVGNAIQAVRAGVSYYSYSVQKADEAIFDYRTHKDILESSC